MSTVNRFIAYLSAAENVCRCLQFCLRKHILTVNPQASQSLKALFSLGFVVTVIGKMTLKWFVCIITEAGIIKLYINSIVVRIFRNIAYGGGRRGEKLGYTYHSCAHAVFCGCLGGLSGLKPSSCWLTETSSLNQRSCLWESSSCCFDLYWIKWVSLSDSWWWCILDIGVSSTHRHASLHIAEEFFSTAINNNCSVNISALLLVTTAFWHTTVKMHIYFSMLEYGAGVA